MCSCHETFVQWLKNLSKFTLPTFTKLSHDPPQQLSNPEIVGILVERIIVALLYFINEGGPPDHQPI
jgi:hypothetical protein